MNPDLDDKSLVSIFWRHAEEIFATARQNAGKTAVWRSWSAPGGAIHIASAEGWNLEALRLHHGAAAAYQVTRRDGQVRVEARSSERKMHVRGSGIRWRFPRAGR